MGRISRCCKISNNNKKGGDGSKGDGFITVEDKSKFKVIKDKQPTKTIRQVQVTTFVPYYRSKNNKQKSKLKSRYNYKTYIKPRFQQAGEIISEWTDLHHTVTINQTDKMTINYTKEVVAEVGSYLLYNNAFEKVVSAKSKVNIKRKYNKPNSMTTAAEDPFLLNQIFNGDLPEGKTLVVMDENVFSTMATCQKTKFPYNIKFNKEGNKLLFSVEPEDMSSTYAQLQTYNENIIADQPEDEKVIEGLAKEATTVSQNLAQLVLIPDSHTPGSLKTKEIQDEKLNEFIEEYEKPFDLKDNKMYKYVKLEINKQYIVYIKLCADAYELDNGVEKPVLIRNLLNINPSSWNKTWASNKSSLKLSSQRDNSSQIQKWMLQAFLQDAETIKVGYGMRKTSKDPYCHKLIGMESLNVAELSKQYNFYINSALACVKIILDEVSQITTKGEFVLNRRAYATTHKIFSVPEDEDSDEEDSDEEESEEEDQEEDQEGQE